MVLFFQGSTESDSSSVGRAAASQAAGRGFEPRLSLINRERATMVRPLVALFFFAIGGQGVSCRYGAVTELVDSSI